LKKHLTCFDKRVEYHLSAGQTKQENEMSKIFTVSANGIEFGQYEADDEQGARDSCARDAGYESEAHMVETLEQPSELMATEEEE
jgi:hypothetical protein